jgi:DUF1009 family protein
LPGISGESVGIIAGSGAFPLEIASSLTRAGTPVFIVGLRGFAERGIKAYPHMFADMLDPYAILGSLKRLGIGKIILAGGVSRPGPMALLSIYTFFRNREELRKIVTGGDDRILRGVIRLFEEADFQVLGVDEAAPDLLATIGPIGRIIPDANVTTDIDLGLDCLATIGRFDIGQGVVVAGTRILAIEGPEGTDAMLKRVADMQKNRRVSFEKPQAILIKASKPGQDRRVDLPAIGPRTIQLAKQAGLIGIAVAAQEVILVERDRLLAMANQEGLFVTGVRIS